MPTSSARDACDFLEADHRAVKKLFKSYEELTGSQARTATTQRMEIAREICHELTVHTQLEEEIFYPRVRAAIKEKDTLAEALVEHASAKELIAKIKNAQEVNETFDATVKVLGEYVEHHIKEERAQIFPKARTARGLDLLALRSQLESRKEELMEEMKPETYSAA